MGVNLALSLIPFTIFALLAKKVQKKCNFGKVQTSIQKCAFALKSAEIRTLPKLESEHELLQSSNMDKYRPTSEKGYRIFLFLIAQHGDASDK